jgi:non-specific serine/threonine protein kinase
MVGKTLGHYRILEKIGEGGMGVVYLAHDERLDRDVALKVLPEGAISDEDVRKRFRQEALILSKLNHPNIETVYDLDMQDGVDFLVMEYVSGCSLAEKIAQQADGALVHVFPQIEILNVGMQLADGLAAAHEQGVIHRDLKPGNLRIALNGRLKILDFGLARLLKPATDSAITATNSGIHGVSGTLPYMPPEQLRGERGDARSDIYAVGIVLLQMASGKPPGVWGPGMRERISPELQRILRKCIEREPEQRYATARELLEDLRQLSAGKQGGQSVAVLYLENLSGEQKDEYFRDGITEDIITELGKVQPLRVFPRSAVLDYRNKPTDVHVVGRRLGAAFVLSGSLRRSGNRVRITTQLVDTNTGHSVWAERFDRELKDVFEVQAEIARSIAQALRITISPQEERAIAAKPTKNPHAYDCYIKARSLARRCTRTDLGDAIEMYERAIALDEHFALAYAGLGLACALFYEWHEKDPRWIARATMATNRAMQLEQDLPEALAACARVAWAQGNYQDAATLAKSAVLRKPSCESAYWILEQAYFNLDCLKEMAELAEQALEFSGADYNVYVPLYLCFERLGNTDAARRVRERQSRALLTHLEEVPEDVRAHILLSGNYAAMGNHSEAIHHVQTAVALRPNDSNVLYNAACAYGIMNNKSKAVEFLHKARDAGFAQLDWAARDTDLTCLHSEPEFQKLFEKTTAKA